MDPVGVSGSIALPVSPSAAPPGSSKQVEPAPAVTPTDSAPPKAPRKGKIPAQVASVGAASFSAPPAAGDDPGRFVRDWLRELLDPTLSPRQRLNLQPRLPASSPGVYGTSKADGTAVPPPAALNGAQSPSDLADKVDAWYGGTPPDTNTVAQNMGAEYDSNYYDDGRGGSIVADISPYDLFNNGNGVCVEIHSAIAAYRWGKGQEAYVVVSSAVSNAHVFLIFKDEGKWYIQNYGTVVETDARTLRELFDQTMPEEIRPRLYRPTKGGKMEPVAQDFLTGAGLDQRRFSDEAGLGLYDPFRIARDSLRLGTDGLLLAQDGAVAYTDFNGRGGLGYYTLSPVLNGLLLRGGAIEVVPQADQMRGKYEHERRWLTSERAGRQRWSVFGGLELGVPRALYWDEPTTYQAVKLGGSYAREDSWLSGRGPLRVETGYDLKLRGAYTYGLNQKTKDAYLKGLNDPNASYFGDFNRIPGDIDAGGGPHLGVFWRPTSHLLLRSGLRGGLEFSNFDALKNWKDGLLHTLTPSAYGEAQVRTGIVAAGAVADVPLLDRQGYVVGGGVVVSPSKKLSAGAGYFAEHTLNETDDSLRGAVEYRPSRGVGLRVEGQAAGPGRDFEGDYRAMGFLQVDMGPRDKRARKRARSKTL